ncbi:MAG: hypothetical protein VB120_02055 [Lachnospiraceae bacterium]|nr:hypothetical protein [Lachnospiraceae bacterium]
MIKRIKKFFTGILAFALLFSGLNTFNAFAEEDNVEEVSYRVVYASNGSGVDMETMPDGGDTATEGDTYILSSAVPSRESTETYNYNFLGWGTTSRGNIVTSIYVSPSNIGDGTNGTFKLDVYGRIIIYAVWEAVEINQTYGLVYTTNGVYVDQNDLPSNVTGIGLGETYTLEIPETTPLRYSDETKTTPTHVFRGWATQGGNNNEAYAVTEITAPSIVGWAVTENSDSLEVRDFEGLRVDNAGLSVDTCGRITVYAIWEEYVPENPSDDNGDDNGDDSGDDNGDDNGSDNGDDNGSDNGDDDGSDNGDDNGSDNGDDNGSDNSGNNEDDSPENLNEDNGEETQEEVMGVSIEKTETPMSAAPEETDEIIIEEEPSVLAQAPEALIAKEATPLGDVPQTGDTLNILKWIVASAMYFAGIMLLLFCGNKKEDRNNSGK